MNVIVDIIVKTITPRLIKNISCYIKLLLISVPALIIKFLFSDIISVITAAYNSFNWYPNLSYIVWQTFL